MLTQRQLSLLRAALQFFDEEIVPHGSQIVRMYLDVPRKHPVTSAEIQELRSFLRKVDVKYGRYQPSTQRLSGTRLNTSLARTRARDGEVTVVMLIPRQH